MLIELLCILLTINHLILLYPWSVSIMIDDYLTYNESPPDLWFQTQKDDDEDIS